LAVSGREFLVLRLTGTGFESDGVGLKFGVARQERLDQ
jgi:hypothetical protein